MEAHEFVDKLQFLAERFKQRKEEIVSRIVRSSQREDGELPCPDQMREEIVEVARLACEAADCEVTANNILTLVNSLEQMANAGQLQDLIDGIFD